MRRVSVEETGRDLLNTRTTGGKEGSKKAVIPAKAGIHVDLDWEMAKNATSKWIPAFAGMTASLKLLAMPADDQLLQAGKPGSWQASAVPFRCAR
jgi:hypothetical protein